MYYKTQYALGFFFLLLGLIWLNAYETPVFNFLTGIDSHSHESSHSQTEEAEEHEHTEDDASTKTILYSLPGLIPTLLGIFMIERSNKKFNNIKRKR